MMSGAVCIAGGITSGGSVKNWKIDYRGGTIIEMVDVPEALALKAVADYPGEVTIVRPASVDRDALSAERAALLARLAEIDALLADTPGALESVDVP